MEAERCSHQIVNSYASDYNSDSDSNSVASENQPCSSLYGESPSTNFNLTLKTVTF